ncbi:MAG: acyl-CoA dehydrogenase family protein, partial [Candidatus Binataceae bacterium]
MDFNYSADDEAFRVEFRTWLEANLTKELAQGELDFFDDTGEDWERRLAWHRKMHAAGWVGISWPKEYGGRGASL